MNRRHAAAALAVAALLAGCGSSSSSSGSATSGDSSGSGGSSGGASGPGVTATSITFGTHQPLTGPAAPGYSEIAPASQAYFDYVNAHGGVYGRKIHLIIKDDAYNPTNTVNVVHQLVLQDNVFGIFEGLGTPTHTKVVGFLNASKVPDMFVSSGCPCWDNGSTQPYTFGWLPNYTIEGKILGQYIKQHFLPARDDDTGPADHRDQGGRREGPRRVHRPDLHRDRATDIVHARVLPAARRVQRRDRPDDCGGPPEGGIQGQGVGDGVDRGCDH
jgi:hypothetical protein